MTQQRADYPLDYTNGTDVERTAKDKVHDMAANATDQLNKAADSAQAFVENIADQAKVYGEKAQEAVREFKPYVEKSMKEQPTGTLAVAAVIGFALGALWKK